MAEAELRSKEEELDEEKSPKLIQNLSLAQFLELLDQALVEEPLSMRDLMHQIAFNKEEWAKYIHESQEHYTRNLVSSKDFVYDLLLLVWVPGQRSAIHDHKESSCWMRILQGELTEKRYVEVPTPEGSRLELVAAKAAKSPDVLYIDNDRGVHAIENTGAVTALSLHLYSPPITECRVWSNADVEKPGAFKASFHSIYGIVLPQHMFKPSPAASIGGKYWPLGGGGKGRKKAAAAGDSEVAVVASAPRPEVIQIIAEGMEDVAQHLVKRHKNVE